MRRINYLFVGLFLAISVSLTLLLFPNGMSKRVTKAGELLSASNTNATDQDMALVKSTHQYIITPQKRSNGDLYLFMPAQQNHVALVYNPKNNNFIKEYFRDVTIHVIPVTEPDSPHSVMAMKLALNYQGQRGQTYIDLVAASNDDVLEQAWKSLPSQTKKELDRRLETNKGISQELGQYQTFLTYGSVTVKCKSWSDLLKSMGSVHNLVDRMF